MKNLFLFVLLCHCCCTISAQQTNKIENVIIITTDGFRWQEVFRGMDSSLASDHNSNQADSAAIFKKYWAATVAERRKKLMPFLWKTINANGQIYGNRDLGSKVNTANPYWFSYPGYSEIFCGYVDTLINSNDYKPNPNTNLLEFLNKQKSFHDKVAAFGAWDAFHRILNDTRNGIPVTCSRDTYASIYPGHESKLIDDMKADSYNPLGDQEKLDVFTHYAAMNYLENKKPKVLYISYGETDEWAHHGQYKNYLDAAKQVDKWISDIWNYIQVDKQYKNNTLLLITVDHGRGNATQWTSHHDNIPGSDEIWFAVMGPQIKAKGESRDNIQLYQKQYAQTIAQLLGLNFTCEHPVADGFKERLTK